MATWSWKDIDTILVDGYNLQAALVIDLSIPKRTAIIDTLMPAGHTWALKRDTGGRRVDGDVVLRLPYDDADNYSVEALRTNAHVVDGVVCVALKTGVAGKTIHAFKAHQLDFVEEPGADVVTKIAATWAVNGQVHRPIVVRAYAAIAGDGDTESASLDGGTQAAAVNITSSSVANPSVITAAAAHGLVTGDTVLIAGHTSVTPDINGSHVVTVTGDTTFTIPVNVTDGGVGGTLTRTNSRSGGVAVMQVTDLDLDGADGIQVTMRDSADNSTFADLGAFDEVTTDRGAEVLDISGNVDRYVAVEWEFTGTPGSPTGYLFVAFARG